MKRTKKSKGTSPPVEAGDFASRRDEAAPELGSLGLGCCTTFLGIVVSGGMYSFGVGEVLFGEKTTGFILESAALGALIMGPLFILVHRLSAGGHDEYKPINGPDDVSDALLYRIAAIVGLAVLFNVVNLLSQR